MKAGFLDRRGGRLAVMAFLLLIWQSPAAHATAAGVLEPFPDKGEDRARHKRPVLPEGMIFPGVMSSTPVVPVQVHPLFPNDGAVFPPAAVITLSWRMPDKKAQPETLRVVPRFFRVEMIGHTYPASNTVRYFPYTEKRPVYNGIFSVGVSGRYGWQVTAVMDDGSIIKSPTRYFVVRQPYYYNNYFNVIPDVYPHYSYDSQEFLRR